MLTCFACLLAWCDYVLSCLHVYMLACRHAYQLAYLLYSRAYMFGVLDVLMCLRAWRAYALTCLACLCAICPYVLKWSLLNFMLNILTFLPCSRTYVLAYLEYLCVYFIACSPCLSAHVLFSYLLAWLIDRFSTPF